MVLETSRIDGVSFCKSEKLFGLALNCPFSEVFFYIILTLKRISSTNYEKHL